ncbi:hypothetical protein Y032_0005g2733 [Ancylostoma ceylanicum]|uniref:Uncharacterized protein n=1 Tax=Ancylostoma ceylanicum TaxID=53326 RepID=A0A016VU97_9BILA|nr:hypothetical protein Y032_0005g2733 [Ancylostoma ceylanicum]
MWLVIDSNAQDVAPQIREIWVQRVAAIVPADTQQRVLRTHVQILKDILGAVEAAELVVPRLQGKSIEEVIAGLIRTGRGKHCFVSLLHFHPLNIFF